MHTTQTRAPTESTLPDGLHVRTLRDRSEIPRLATFAASVFGDAVGPLQSRLLTDYPGIEPADQFLVETEDGEIVSALGLVPWTWRYGGVDLPVGEMSIVCTAPAYRRQGLVRAQAPAFKARLAERGCLLSNIQGIPYYYRQFGYEYALPLDCNWQLELRHAPEEAPEGLTSRPATPADLPRLMALYEEAMAGLTLHTVRSEAVWRHILAPDRPQDAFTHVTWVIFDAANRAVGYARARPEAEQDTMMVTEVSSLPIAPAQAMLARLRHEATQAGLSTIRLNLPESTSLVQLARVLGARNLGDYAWQIHVPDWAALLWALAPALTARLQDSPFAEWTQDFRLGYYRGALRLRLVDGQVTAVESMRPDEEVDAMLPPMAMTPLVLGQRDLDELRHAYPDVMARGVWRLLLETLFPKFPAFLYPAY